ncbi:MAG: TonB-dependent receptor domain-containing protein [Janthinobacterium lividum]
MLALAPVLYAAPAYAQQGVITDAQSTPNDATGTPLSALPTLGNASGNSGPTPESVTVTGSRLRTSNLTSEAPITVITSKQIEQSSAQTISDVLRKIPAIGTAGTYSTTDNGGNGSNCIDLRNLGIARTLVLVNGKRFVHTPYGDGFDCVDLSTIPVAMVDRIDIEKDGASTIYGADAVAGVINIITKKNYVGTQLNADGGITASGDGRQGTISGTTGFDFSQGRGNVALSGSYSDLGAIAQKDRDWAEPVISADSGPDGGLTIGSGYTPAGRIFSASGATLGTVIGNKLVHRNSTFLGGTDGSNVQNGRYNYGYDTLLQNRTQQGNLDGSAHYDFNDHVTAYIDAYYTHKDSQSKLSGQPISGTVDGSMLYDIPRGNPFAEALGIDQDVSQYKRTIDWGPRTYETHADVYQFTGGLKGNITGNWDYDAYYSYGRATNVINQTNQVNFTKLEREAGFRGTDPSNPDAGVYDPSVCTSSPGCVLGNPFGSGGLSQAGINYASFTSHSVSFYQVRDLGVTITNNKLIRLPYGPLGLAIGMEHRGEDGAYHPDPIVQSGQSLANTESPTGGGFNVTEAFGELNIPILKNLPFAKDLSADVSGRYSDYSTFGSVENWKAGINWSPSRDIRFRANIGSSVRQPQIYEAFGGITTGFPSATDPCDSGQVGTYGALSGVVAANCAVKIKGYNNSFTQAGSGQIPTNSGGNPNLQPETSRTYTFGTVVTPRFLPNFTATVDYFHTKIANSIGTVSTQYILDNCYESTGLSSSFCSGVNPRASNGQLSTVNSSYQNLGETRTSGIDFDLNYLIKLRHGFNLNLSNSMVDTVAFIEQQTPGGPFQNFKGRLISGLYGTAYPVIRDNATATIAKGGFSFSWTTRFIDSMKVNDGSNDLTPETAIYYKTNEVFYHDIVATYNWKKVQFIGGIDNLFDKTPLLVIDGTTNTDPNVYDIRGRFFYAKMQLRF